MISLPSVRHLRHLTALYDHGHFGRAADACHVTQSTLSASIKELESVLQVTLVDRSKRSVVLTPVGIETVERARKIVKEVEDLVSFTTASREPLSGTLRMGTIPTIGPFLLPRVLPGLREAYRGLKLYLVEDLTDRLVASLHRGELDVVLLALPRECGAVETATLFEDPFVVGLPRGHPLAKEGGIKPQHLLDEDLLSLKDGHCLRDHALTALRHLADRRWLSSRRQAYRLCCKWSQRTRCHIVADAGDRCRVAAGHSPGHAALAPQSGGKKDQSCLASRNRTS
jgi:LysR family hydrogen peroxide-inducible transcriptional activator